MHDPVPVVNDAWATEQFIIGKSNFIIDLHSLIRRIIR